MRVQILRNDESVFIHSDAGLTAAMLTGHLRIAGCLNADEVAAGMLEPLTEVEHCSTFEGLDDLKIVAKAVV